MTALARESPSESPLDRGNSRAIGWEWLVAPCLLGALLAVRLVALHVDPPGDMHIHFLPDEGWWAHNARDHAVFGQWIMDDHNPPLFAAPLYTVLLRAHYALFGVGLTPTRALAGFFGWATCVLLYLFMRPVWGWRTACAGTWLLGANYFMLAHNRVAFVESVQLFFLTACLMSVVRAVERPRWAAVAGLMFLCAVATKISAAPMVLTPMLFWGHHWVMSRRERANPPFRFRAVLMFAAAAASASTLCFIIFVWPHLSQVVHEVRSSLLIASTGGSGGFLQCVGLFGTAEEDFRPNGFVSQAVGLIVIAALIVVARLATRQTLPYCPVRSMLWCWIMTGLLTVLSQQYQPDRRFLQLIPPLAMVAALAVRKGVIVLSGSATDAWPGGRWRATAIGTTLFLFAGLYFRGPLIQYFINAGQHLSIGMGTGLSPGLAGCVTWIALIVVGGGLGQILRRPLSGFSLRIPGLALLLMASAFDVGRATITSAHPTFSEYAAMQEIAGLMADWPEERRVAVGKLADAFALETRMFAFVIRHKKEWKMFMNPDGWERFSPAVYFHDRSEGPPIIPASQDMHLWRQYGLFPDHADRPRYGLDVYVRRDLLPPPVNPH